MGERTGISWTDHTANFWWGCQKVSPGCDHCYAEAFDKRVGGAHWGPGAPRRRTGPQTWNAPLRWNRAAGKAGVRRRVFTSSMADFFDNAVPPEWRAEAWKVIRACPHLDWQVLTKRPQNIAKMLPADWGDGWPNVWLGTTVENQAEADRRIPHLLAVPAQVRFLSCEPLIGPVNLDVIRHAHGWASALDGWEEHGGTGQTVAWYPPVDWVIVGGESGHGARPMHYEWATDLLRQCQRAEVAAFFKQLGSRPDFPMGPFNRVGCRVTGKGDDPAQWPPDLRVQQFPEAPHA